MSLVVRNAAWWRERIGKTVVFRSKFSILDRQDEVLEVHGKNVRTGRDWLWIPDIVAGDVPEVGS